MTSYYAKSWCAFVVGAPCLLIILLVVTCITRRNMIKAVVSISLNGEEKPVVSRPITQSLAVTLGGAPFEPELFPGDADYELHVPATSIDRKDADTPDA